MRNRQMVPLLFGLLVSAIAFGQDLQYPKLSNVQVHAIVRYNDDEKMYYYGYTLVNDVMNSGSIDAFAVDISRVASSLIIDTIGLHFENDGFTEGSFRRNFPHLGSKIIPVGFLKTPGGTWTGGLSDYLLASFDGTRTYAIRPGAQSSGFEMMSKGLPSIRRCIVSPFFDFDSLFSKERFPNEQDIPNTDSIQSAAKFYGWTIGPTAPPMSFISSDWLDTLVSYANQSRALGWIRTQPIAGKYINYFLAAKSQLQANNTGGARSTLQSALNDFNVDSSSTLTSEAYALIRYNTEYLLSQLPPAPPPGLNIKLINSTGMKLAGGSLQYYDGSWKDALNNNDGTFSVTTSLTSLSLRMTYEGGSQTKSNVTVGPDTVVFQTVNTQVKLQNSQGVLIDTGFVQYYSSSWRAYGTTTNGVASKELLPGSYTFRMSYASATKDLQQDISTNAVVMFQTVSAAVQLQNSQGVLMDQGTVQYYFSSWNTFGSTTNGVATKELLPANYTFRMSYAAATNDKQQNIGTNPTVVFQTANTTMQLKNSQGTLIDQGTVQYYFSSWNSFGSTSNGVATKELLPGNYTFRMGYESATNDKQQNIGTNPTVVFQTVLASVQVKNSQGNPIDTGSVQYYFSSWKTLGLTSNGVATKELLPASYTFRTTYESVSNDKVQNIGTNSTVVFSTVLCTVTVKNSQSQPVDNAMISYYSTAWKQIGLTVGGQVTKELLPANLTFRATVGGVTQDKVQNIGTNALVQFTTQ